MGLNVFKMSDGSVHCDRYSGILSIGNDCAISSTQLYLSFFLFLITLSFMTAL